MLRGNFQLSNKLASFHLTHVSSLSLPLPSPHLHFLHLLFFLSQFLHILLLNLCNLILKRNFLVFQRSDDFLILSLQTLDLCLIRVGLLIEIVLDSLQLAVKLGDLLVLLL